MSVSKRFSINALKRFCIKGSLWLNGLAHKAQTLGPEYKQVCGSDPRSTLCLFLLTGCQEAYSLALCQECSTSIQLPCL